MLANDDDAGFYRTLGCDPRASASEIKRAYHALARQLHPDRRQDEQAREQMAKVGEAWAVLKNPRLRRAYDEEGREGVDNLSDFEDDEDEDEHSTAARGASSSGATGDDSRRRAAPLLSHHPQALAPW